MALTGDTDVYALVGTPLYVGLSAIIGVTIQSGYCATVVKYASGGSLEIGGSSMSWGTGYLFGVNEAVSINMRGTFFLAATGATATVYLLTGLSQGATP